MMATQDHIIFRLNTGKTDDGNPEPDNEVATSLAYEHYDW